jgi:hypothetical protein
MAKMTRGVFATFLCDRIEKKKGGGEGRGGEMKHCELVSV